MTKPLLEELDNEIERAKKTISDIHYAKELQLKNFLELFDLKNVEGGRSFEDALKTLRKLPRFLVKLMVLVLILYLNGQQQKTF